VFAVLVTVVVACALVYRISVPELQVAESPENRTVAERDNAKAAKLNRPPAQAPEPTTVVIASRTRPREVRLQQPVSLTGDRLIRELQHELKRVGCYSHEINGEWTPITRRAMKDFTDRVNAILPLEAPDAVMLALLHTHVETVCGSACPAGQSLAKDNRCLPSALLAANAKKTETTEVVPPSIAAPTTTPVARARRMAVRHSTPGSGIFGLLGW
jgi:hypothetical protein